MRLITRLSFIIGMVVVLSASCGNHPMTGGTGGGTGGSGGGTGGGTAQTDGGKPLTLEAPETIKVGQELTVTVHANDPRPNHIHYWIDDDYANYQVGGKVAIKVPIDGATWVGKHKFSAEGVTVNHESFNPSIKASLSFTVEP